MQQADYGIKEHVYPSRSEGFIHFSSLTTEANTLMGFIEEQPPRHCSASLPPPPSPRGTEHHPIVPYADASKNRGENTLLA